MSNPRLDADFYKRLEHEIFETVSKTQGLFAACCRFDRFFAFSVSFNRLEPLKLSATRL